LLIDRLMASSPSGKQNPGGPINDTMDAARTEKWFRNFAQDDKWNFRLTAGTLVPANQERP